MIQTLETLFLPSEFCLLNPDAGRTLEADGVFEQHAQELDVACHRRGPWLAAAFGQAAESRENAVPSRFQLWHAGAGLVIGGDRALGCGGGTAMVSPADGSGHGGAFPTEARTGLAGRWVFLEQASEVGTIRFRVDLDEDLVAGINVDWNLTRAACLNVRLPVAVPSGSPVVLDGEIKLPEEPGIFPVRQRMGITGGVSRPGYTLIIPAGVRGHVQYPVVIGPARLCLARLECSWDLPMLHGFARFVVRVESPPNEAWH